MKKRYALGLDYGTASARGTLVDLDTGLETEIGVLEYPHGVLDKTLPDGTVLPPDYALQDADDYEQALTFLLTQAGKAVPPDAIRAIGLDFTACTVLPVDQNMAPLSRNPAYRRMPHSYCKLWKHHSAGAQAKRIMEAVAHRNMDLLDAYGNQCSSEWYLPKLLELYEEAPELYRETYRFVNASDWVNYLLTGTLSTSRCTAGFKCFLTPDYPETDFLEALAPGFGNALAEKLACPVLDMGACAGYLTDAMAQKTGLPAGIPVAASVIDAHSALPAAGIIREGDLLMSMGTSICHILVQDRMVNVPGISGAVDGGIYPGLCAYEAGQCAVGDIYGWFTKTFGLSFRQLTEKAQALRPGESGLLALDWWNGNRSILSDADLTGSIFGLNLNTRPEEIYRALVESTAFGGRIIHEAFREAGVPVKRIFACGGLSKKSALVMQIFADVMGQPITVIGREQAAAYGAAMYGAVAAGIYPDMAAAIDALGAPCDRVYTPQPEAVEVYNRLFAIYRALHDDLGEGSLLHALKKLRETT